MNTNSTNIKVICPKDCGNSPKKKLLTDLSIAFAKYSVEDVVGYFTDHIVWDLVGDKLIRGKDQLIEELDRMRNHKVSEIQISNVITHGSAGSVNGMFIQEDKKCFAFCSVYNFTSAGKNSKIKKITSYIIETELNRDTK